MTGAQSQGTTSAGSESGNLTIGPLTVGPVAHGGHFVARHEGRVVFVRHALPGERVMAELTEAEPGSSFFRADVTEVLQPSEHRQEHFWPLADSVSRHAAGLLPVGGTEFGHIALNFQRELKTQVLTEQLSRLAGIDLADSRLGFSGVEPAAGDSAAAESAEGLGWRTRMAYGVDSSGRLSMHPHRSEELVPVDQMPLAVAAINDLHLGDADFSGASRVEVAATASGEALVLVAAGTKDFTRIADSLAGLEASGTSITVAQWNPEQGKARTPDGATPSLLESSPVGALRVSTDGFWQIHRAAPATLTAAVGEFLTGVLPTGGVAVDLYAGVGLFTSQLAQLVGEKGRVLSVEGYPVTSADAAANFAQDASVTVVQGKVERVLSRPVKGFPTERVSTVLLDPPRAGAGKAAVRQIAALARDAVVYVSCDPASFARDVGYFAQAGWELAALRAFDLYPHTHHTETVALLCPAG